MFEGIIISRIHVLVRLGSHEDDACKFSNFLWVKKGDDVHINCGRWDLVADDDDAETGKLASAMGLIMGTAVGPGILGLPAATLQAGLIPSTVTILAAWAYVMASILLVAELSYGGELHLRICSNARYS
jgi:hypothetical protein